MIYQIIVPESVYEELNEAALYYESKQKDLGVKFVLNCEITMVQLKKTPEIYQRKHKQFRTIPMNAFPYLLVYEIQDNKLIIYRLIHGKRNPKTIFK